MIRQYRLDSFFHREHSGLYALCVFDGVGNLLVFGGDFLVFLQNQLALLADFGGALLHDFLEFFLVVDELFGICLHEQPYCEDKQQGIEYLSPDGEIPRGKDFKCDCCFLAIYIVDVARNYVQGVFART